MHYILGTLALLGVGLIGLLIEIHKQDQWTITSLGETIEQLAARNVELMGNQKPVPWNKGKKGYKLNRKPKETALETLLPLPEVGDSIALFTPRLD